MSFSFVWRFYMAVGRCKVAAIPNYFLTISSLESFPCHSFCHETVILSLKEEERDKSMSNGNEENFSESRSKGTNFLSGFSHGKSCIVLLQYFLNMILHTFY